MKDLTKAEAKKRIEKLKTVISYHRYLYHVLNKQEISDAVLDSLKHELYKLEQKFPEFITSDSPTQRVGGKALEKFKKVKHLIPMLSIEDVFSEKELQDWRDYLKRLQPSAKFEYFSELKIDGFAITLIYEKGVFVLGATRGDGRIGEDVTQNLKTIESIPLKLGIRGKPPSPEIKNKLKKLISQGIIEVRGEIYMEKKDFEKFNQEQKKKGLPAYSNPRNLAAGSIRQLDPKLAASRPLKFLAYGMVSDIGQKRHSEEHQILPTLGFKADIGQRCQNLNQVIEFWKEIAKKREKFPFQIDGIVVNVDENSLFKKLGIVGKSHRGARALKFAPKQTTTKVLDIKIQIGRTGAVTPVAYLEPVQVGGVTISRATLHNEDEIKRLGVRIGDTVIVGRAGDVIPVVIGVLPNLRTGKEGVYRMPKHCPVCGIALVRVKGEVVWRCPNKQCRARRKKFLYHFVSKKAFDIEGLGPKIIDQFIEKNLISEAPDIFKLEEGDLKPLERFAEKSAQNIISAIQASKEITLSRFIYALGIRHVGEETAIDLANSFGSINSLKKASKEEIEALPDIGPEVSKSIYNWFQSPKNLRLIDELFGVGIKISPLERFGKKLAGKTFILTGAFKSMTRSEAERKIRLLGGHPSSSISRQTDFLVVGENPGSKLEKAKKLGVKIIGEKEFLEIIKPS